MPSKSASQFLFYSDPLQMYISMLSDIEKAEKYIYLETYKFGYHAIGQKFRYALLKKCKEGVEVKLLIDSWGSSVSRSFFQPLIQQGAEVKYFKKLKLTFDALTKHHRRDHRKLLIIDDEITYIGSANITDYCINWRESNLRIQGALATAFKKLFLENIAIYNKYFYDKKAYTQPVKYYNYEIIRDVPSTLLQPMRKKFMDLIKNAKEEIIIETPYFLPGTIMRKAIRDAGERGVKVKIIIPKRSDVGLVDILRNKYLGNVYGSNVHIYFYVPQNLHAKLFLVDQETFILGSSNFDYRSFRFQHEINLVGSNKDIIKLLNKHFEASMLDSESFDYEFWQKRSPLQKFFELVLVPFRHFF